MAEEDALFIRGRMGQAGEVAGLVYFLASDEASFCTEVFILSTAD